MTAARQSLDVSGLDPGADETLDSICGGVVRLLQRKRGYRFNLDPILLAHFANPKREERVIDLGTGVGILPLLFACKFGVRSALGIELQPALYSLAERNVRLNRCDGRVSVILGDLRELRSQVQQGSFKRAVCNPPYRPSSAGRVSPNSERAVARHELHCTVIDAVRAAAWAVCVGGAVDFVYPAARLGELVVALADAKLTPRRLRLVHPKRGVPASLCLIEALKRGRNGLEVEPPLYLHGADGQFSEEVQTMLDRTSA